MRRILSILLLAAALGSASASTGGKEAWGVDGGGNTIIVVDLAAAAVSRTIPLPQVAGAPEPHGITFSTVDGAIGDYAFVAQGDTIYVIEADTAMITNTINLAVEIGLPATVADLAAGPSRPFDIQAGGFTVENHLYAAADVRPPGSTVSEPYFVVLDQKVLTGAVPAGTLVKAFGPLVPASVPAAERGSATGVTVLGAEAGPARERAWFTTRGLGSVWVSRAVRVASDELGALWDVDRVIETDYPMGQEPPVNAPVAAPYDREIPVMPTGELGSVVNLDTGGECAFVGADLRQAAIAGPGPGAIYLLALDVQTDSIYRINPTTCDFDSFALAPEPVAMALDDVGVYGNAVVASRSGHTISIVSTDGTVTEVMLPPATALNDIEIRKCCDGCSVSGLAVSILGSSDRLTWTKYGCLGCEVRVFCQCQDGSDTSCPCYCPPTVPTPPPGSPPGTCYPNLPPAPPAPPMLFVALGGTVIVIDPFGTSETPWIHLGNSVSSDYTHTGAAPFGLNYTIMPKVP